MIDYVVQAWILAFGVTAHYFNQEADGTRRRRWAPVLGIAAQAGWLTMAARSEPVAYGVVVLVALYGYGWWRGLRREWGSNISRVA